MKIAKKISGIVVAPDGVAYGSIGDDYNGTVNGRFYSYTYEGNKNDVNELNWYYFSRKKNSYRNYCIGWTLYNGIGTVSCKNTIFTRKVLMSIYDISSYLVSGGYIQYK